MRNKKALFAVFALVILAVPLYIMISSDSILRDGHKHKLHLRGFDPFDPFRGKYLRLSYDNFIPCDENLEMGDKAYVSFEKDSLGFSRFAFAESEKPNHDDYYLGEVIYASGECRIKLDNIEKYFINEDLAEKAEDVVQDFTRNQPDDIYVEVAVMDGEMRLNDIFIKKQPLKEYLNELPTTP